MRVTYLSISSIDHAAQAHRRLSSSVCFRHLPSTPTLLQSSSVLRSRASWFSLVPFESQCSFEPCALSPSHSLPASILHLFARPGSASFYTFSPLLRPLSRKILTCLSPYSMWPSVTALYFPPFVFLPLFNVNDHQCPTIILDVSVKPVKSRLTSLSPARRVLSAARPPARSSRIDATRSAPAVRQTHPCTSFFFLTSIRAHSVSHCLLLHHERSQKTNDHAHRDSRSTLRAHIAWSHYRLKRIRRPLHLASPSRKK